MKALIRKIMIMNQIKKMICKIYINIKNNKTIKKNTKMKQKMKIKKQFKIKVILPTTQL